MHTIVILAWTSCHASGEMKIEIMTMCLVFFSITTSLAKIQYHMNTAFF